jgi:anti-sigma factor RsiW
MNCEGIRERFAEYLTGDIDDAAKAELRAHIAACASCREELEGLSAVWTRLGVLPREQPSGRLREGFYAMLEGEARKVAEIRAPGRARAFWRGLLPPLRPAHAFATGVLLLAVGIAAGFLLREGSVAARTTALRGELQEMNRTVALSMMDRPAASDRLEGIGLSARLEKPDRRMLQALVDTLDGDLNVNVRLAAVDALYLFRNDAGVKDSLVRSLAKQDSPLVQVALIDLLVEIRERRAADALKQLIGTRKLNPEVKQHAELGLEQII